MPSESEFIGSLVSIDCGQLGIYQGRVEKVDSDMNTLTISHAFHNGLSCDLPEISLSSTAILDIRIIHTSHDAQEIITRKATPSKMTKEIDEATKPTCTFPVKIIKAASKFQPASSGSGVSHLDLAHGAASSRRALSPGNSPSKFLDSGQGAMGRRHRISRSVNRESSMPKFNEKGNESRGSRELSKNGGSGYTTDHNRKTTIVKKLDRGRKGVSVKDDCFSASVESFKQDFDFESNLAMFNKKAVFQEIENGFREQSVETEHRERKYRPDENILQPGEDGSAPVIMKQHIGVPEQISHLYYTDTGLVVPSISLEQRESVCEAASQSGLTDMRLLEAYGRGASEMAIQLIGGSHRIHPKNGHQMPAVAVLCGLHEAGAMGACCARILSTHGVQVTVFMPPGGATSPPILTQEIELYKLTGSPLIRDVREFPGTLDLIITALDCPSSTFHSQQQQWHQSIMSWIKSTDIRAQVLALDPPPRGPSIAAKWSLCKVLPLNKMSSMCGSLYLCDLSIPSAIFKNSGIMYTSPFGSKFVISLHAHQ